MIQLLKEQKFEEAKIPARSLLDLIDTKEVKDALTTDDDGNPHLQKIPVTDTNLPKSQELQWLFVIFLCNRTLSGSVKKFYDHPAS